MDEWIPVMEAVSRQMKIQVKQGLEIGDECPPFIIAEVGSNWRTLDDCKASIVAAKQCGADAVKFQAFTSESLYGFSPEEALKREVQELGAVGWIHVQPHPTRKYSMPLEWLSTLREKADACGIEFMCTAFSPELYDAVNPYVSIHKIASAEATHVRILEKARSFGKPVILSTGAKGVADIGRALDVFAGRNTQTPDAVPLPVILMYCVAAYPAQEINLSVLESLRSTFGVLVGYSDHSTDICVVPKSSVDRGACVIEKHFTAIPDADTPDRPHSLTPGEFAKMAAAIRGGDCGIIGPTGEEKGMILRHNRRLIATRDINPGDTFQEGANFGIYRSLKDDTRALSPFLVDAVNGRKAAVELKAGDGIGPGDF